MSGAAVVDPRTCVCTHGDYLHVTADTDVWSCSDCDCKDFTARPADPARTTFEIAETSQPQIEAVITHIEDDDFTFRDYLAATWQPWRSDHSNDEAGYWLISGDNTGSQQLVVWPYMIDAMTALLARCKAAAPDARSAQPANPEGAAQSGSPSEDGT